MKSDIEIAMSAVKLNITEIAKNINITEKDLEMYGKYKAKINLNIEDQDKAQNLILVTAINPTRAGEGKSTVSVGLVDSLNDLGKSAIGALREPSMGPVFGMKGGATGGGYSQVVPMEDINLHFTGDMHAVTSANNLICACIDNHIHQGNTLQIDINNISFKRVIDMNDRSLREITIGQGRAANGIERRDGFTITAASEIMAILCLAVDIDDLKTKISKIIIATNINGDIITVNDLKISSAVAMILKDAIKPNLVQTLKHNPILIHGGPFANIAHGCNSLIATKTALKVSDYVVTEAGFGSDLGSEKFINIKSRNGNIKPKAIVIVATIRALKLHGKLDSDDLIGENIEAVKLGLENLKRHIQIVQSYGVDFVIAINKFATDTSAELQILQDFAKRMNYRLTVIDVFTDNMIGAKPLAQEIINICDNYQDREIQYTYNEDDCFEDKLNKIISLYGAKSYELSSEAKEDLKFLQKHKLDKLKICMAKTPSSFSDDPKMVGAPNDFVIHIKSLKVSSGAGFIVCMIGNTLLMPGLPKIPQAELIDIDNSGKITGLN